MPVKNLFVFSLIIAFATTSCSESEELHKMEKPNIILIMTDDQGWYDAGFNGNDVIKTPHTDLLASQGIILNRFYSASAVCSPTRASVLTGRNPLRMNIPYANSGHLKKEEITLPELLKHQGYATAHFGKWHLGTLTKSEIDANRGGRPDFIQDYTLPTEHGYDQYFCTESKVPTYDPMLYPTQYGEGESKRFGWRALHSIGTSQKYGTAYWVAENQKETTDLRGDDSRILIDRVLPFIENSRKEKKPFFSTIWFHTPHLPVVSDSIHRDYYKELDLKTQLYYGTITAMDEQVGRLWKKLEEEGIEENTILFFCSDNGPERETPGSAGVFRGRKRSLFEGGVRVPAFVIWKNTLRGGRRIDFPMVTSDYLPTLLDILNVEYPENNRPMDGISVLEALKGSQKERTAPIGFIADPHISWVTHRYKLISDKKLESFELYDLLTDSSEQENRLDEFPQVVAKMKMDLLDWLNSVENSKNGEDYPVK